MLILYKITIITFRRKFHTLKINTIKTEACYESLDAVKEEFFFIDISLKENKLEIIVFHKHTADNFATILLRTNPII